MHADRVSIMSPNTQTCAYISRYHFKTCFETAETGLDTAAPAESHTQLQSTGLLWHDCRDSVPLPAAIW